MASLLNPYDPQNAQADTTDPGAYANLQALLGNPGVQGALLSTGLQLMQPPSFGDTATSQIARAIGAGGASAAAQQKQQLAEEEAASKQDLRGSQADLAGARAATAGATANAAADRLSYMQSRDEAQRKLQSLGLQIKLSNAYQAMKSKIDKENFNREFMKQPPLPVPTFDEFVAQNPQLKTLYGGDTGGTPQTPGAASMTTPGADALQQARDAIARGAPRDAVIKRLQERGINPAGL